MNTFHRDNPTAYTGLGVLGLTEQDYNMSEKIGGVKSSDQQANGMTLAGFGVIGEAGCETVIPVTRLQTIQSEQLADNGQPLWQIGKLEPLGVYRPNLEDRKVGKVGMHMVIDGFPRALREVAKVMTWAADAKGYKLHDWRNLPDADTAFPAAEYRHQNDSCIMKAEGTPAIERTDHESNLLHAAHKVFNGLAELELILAGVIK